MKIIYDKYDKQKITGLPIAEFSGHIIVITSKRDTDRAVDYLLTQPILGLDTETRPTFKKGKHNKVALLQVSTESECFLFRLNKIGVLTDSLVRLLKDDQIIRVGLSLKDDFRVLCERKKFTPGRFVEIQQEVKALGVQDMSLQKLYANLLGGHIVKAQQLSNWEASQLTEKQQRYAATDAWSCIQLYKEIKKLIANEDFILEKTEGGITPPLPSVGVLGSDTPHE